MTICWIVFSWNTLPHSFTLRLWQHPSPWQHHCIIILSSMEPHSKQQDCCSGSLVTTHYSSQSNPYCVGTYTFHRKGGWGKMCKADNSFLSEGRTAAHRPNATSSVVVGVVYGFLTPIIRLFFEVKTLYSVARVPGSLSEESCSKNGKARTWLIWFFINFHLQSTESLECLQRVETPGGFLFDPLSSQIVQKTL